MKIPDLILLAESKLQALNTEMATAASIGNTDEMPRIQAEVDDTEETLAILRGIPAP